MSTAVVVLLAVGVISWLFRVAAITLLPATRLPVLAGAAVTAVLAWRARGIVLPVMAGLAAAWLLSLV